MVQATDAITYLGHEATASITLVDPSARDMEAVKALMGSEEPVDPGFYASITDTDADFERFGHILTWGEAALLIATGWKDSGIVLDADFLRLIEERVGGEVPVTA